MVYVYVPALLKVALNLLVASTVYGYWDGPNEPWISSILPLALEYVLDHGITIQLLVTNDQPLDTLVKSLNDMEILVKTISSMVTPCIIIDHQHIWYGGIDIFGKTTSNMIIRFTNMDLPMSWSIWFNSSHKDLNQCNLRATIDTENNTISFTFIPEE